MFNTKNRKVFVGMSGGVDSSVTALLLKNEGYDVTGVYIKTWQPDYIECTSKEDRLDAMRICASLEIPFVTLDLEKEYKRDVIDYMLSEYKNNRVPNPDVMCNKYIKFGAFLDYAKSHNAIIATGHYANIVKIDNGELTLAKAKDASKDQSYFLYQIPSEDLNHILFPLGDMLKNEVKEIAIKNNLHVAEKKESMGICMLGDISMKEFLIRELNPIPGEVRDEDENVLGSHDGVILYTVGERHGFNINNKSGEAASSAHYVTRKDFENNILYVSDKTSIKVEDDKNKRLIRLTNVNVLMPAEKLNLNISYTMQYRYHGPIHKVKILKIEDNTITLEAEEIINNISAGQSIVVYNKDNLVLGGIIV